MPYHETSKKLVSIVTPSYNQGRYLEDCIRSVCQQDYSPIEHIIIDGGSTDHSVDIIRTYENSLAYWVSEKDSGSSDAINKGWRCAKGDYLWVLNSDDWLVAPGAISTLVNYLDLHPDVDFVYGNFYFVNETGQYISSRCLPDYDLYSLAMLDGGQLPFVGCLLRRSALATIGGFESRFRSADDLDFFLRLALRHKLGHVGQFTGYFRVHPQASTQAKLDLSGEETVQVIEEFLNSPDLPPDILRQASRIRARAHRQAMSCYFRYGDSRQVYYHAAKAVRYSPNWLLDPRFLATALLSLCGNNGMANARKTILRATSQRHD